MLRPALLHLMLTALVCLVWACGSGRKGAEASPLEVKSEPPAVRVAPGPATAPGTIRGMVRFSGRKPTMPAIDFSSNPQCERAHPTVMRAESVVVNANHTLRDTFVWIKSGLPQQHWPVPVTAVTLDQAGCLYEPHVLAFRVNQEIEIRNSDPMNHDVNVQASVNAASNDVEAPRGEALRKRYPAQEIWMPVSCGVHPWMRSYLSVVAHPFFKVTGADGGFEWSGVPPGSYTIEAIQEQLGRRERQVTLAPGVNKSVEFVYGE